MSVLSDQVAYMYPKLSTASPGKRLPRPAPEGHVEPAPQLKILWSVKVSTGLVGLTPVATPTSAAFKHALLLFALSVGLSGPTKIWYRLPWLEQLLLSTLICPAMFPVGGPTLGSVAASTAAP